jgi:hypothetical protein
MGYACAVFPDRPLTPAERAVIADLERRLRLDTHVPERSAASIAADVARSVRAQPSGARTRRSQFVRRLLTVPVITLVGISGVLLAASVVAGLNIVGAVAVLASVVATAVVWGLLPAEFGGPVTPPNPPSRGVDPRLSHPR